MRESGNPAVAAGELGEAAYGRLARIGLWGGAALRLALAAANGYSNDDFLPEIRAIAFDHRILKFGESWEAFQPKLYLFLVAPLFAAFDVRMPQLQARVAQLVSALAAIAACYVIKRALDRTPVSPRVRLATLALVVFNPAFVSISAMATNDATVVLMAALALIAGERFFDRMEPRRGVVFAVAVFAACMTKGNALVLFIGAVCTFALALWRAGARDARVRALAYGAVFVTAVATATYFVGPYAAIQRETGSPFTTNWRVPPRAALFHETFIEQDTTLNPGLRRPGLTSVAHGVLTFRLVDMLRRPSDDTQGPPWTTGEYPRHQTSLWSQVYGQAHFSRFAAWPDSWRIRHAWSNWLGRALLVLALVPTGILVAGLAGAALRLVRLVAHPAQGTRAGLGLAYQQIVALGVLAFITVTTVKFRDYGFMKTLYLYPALLAFAVIFARQCEAVYAGLPSVRSRRLLDVVFAALVVGYIVDLSALGVELALWVLKV